ncbi:MerR family transcriptional regulator [Bdellovibrio sp. qaytius]|nr:MerR family transcriptional regulator [Bdellovibrio sp. qaytius]
MNNIENENNQVSSPRPEDQKVEQTASQAEVTTADVQAPAVENAHYEVFQTEFELQLEDNFFEANEEVAPADTDKAKEALETQRNLKADSESFPSVLVDDQLMQEIASIPDRFGFKIGDVADLLGIKQYVLRYWEQEFELLKPKKATNNQRFYTKKDVENAFLIRKLLYRDKFSIEGARQALKDVKFVVKKEKDKEKDFSSVIQRMDFVQDQIKNFVSEIRKTKSFFN